MAGLRETPIRTYARRYRYPRLGMGQLYERIAAEIVALGGEVRTGVRVGSTGAETSGRTRDRRARGRRARPRQDRGGRASFDDCAPRARRQLALAPHALARSRAGRRALRFRSLVFLNLALAREDVSENTWMYVASGALRISRIQEPKRRSPAMAPAGRTSMMLEIPCDVGDDVWTADAHALRERFARELRTLGFAIDDALDAFVVRVEHGYPVYHLGYDEDRRALLAAVERFANVRTAGRQGLFRYVFMDAAMQMGIEAARQMVSGEHAAGRLDAIGRAKTVLETRAITA